MKRISALLLTMAVVLGMTAPVFADGIPASPAEILMTEPGLPMILIIAVLVVTALLVRHFTRKK